MTNKHLVQVNHFTDETGKFGSVVDYGYYISIHSDYLEEEYGDDTAVDVAITDFFADHGIDFNYEENVVKFGAYKDNQEYFFRKESDAESFKKHIEKLIRNFQ